MSFAVQQQLIESSHTIELVQNIANQDQITWQTNRRVRFNPEIKVKYIDSEPKCLMHIKVVGDSFSENDDFKVLQFLESLYWKAVQLRANRKAHEKIRQKKIIEAEIDLRVWRRKNLIGT
ncbi:10123_t:CDS:2 [Cetraspora pellucida]|uniref:10123_t:CDS:1 n=1 Tax=Cetraspora pellucida TaxID=1433469 RepID=A0A9N9IFD0_9GLOM|nr:10123_t:CDS:2 [Cetraspora pellucida]